MNVIEWLEDLETRRRFVSTSQAGRHINLIQGTHGGPQQQTVPGRPQPRRWLQSLQQEDHHYRGGLTQTNVEAGELSSGDRLNTHRIHKTATIEAGGPGLGGPRILKNCSPWLERDAWDLCYTDGSGRGGHSGAGAYQPYNDSRLGDYAGRL